MARKVDLEAAYSRSIVDWQTVNRAVTEHDYPDAVWSAVKGLPHLWDAVGYQRRYLQVEQPPLSTVEVICRYAPPLFARRELDAVEEWWNSGKRSDKKVYAAVATELASAQRAMTLAARLWDAADGKTSLSRDTDDKVAKHIIGTWTAMGVVSLQRSNGATVSRHVTQIDGRVQGKCASCGTSRQFVLLEVMGSSTCERCGRMSEKAIERRLV